MKNHLIKLVIFVFLFNVSSAQNLNALLDAYRGDNARGYLNPLIDLLGANLNTGRSEWAKLDSGFHIRVSAIGSASQASSDLKVFTAITDPSFTPSSSRSVPTIVGKNEIITVQGVNETGYSFQAGYNLKHLLLAAPQISAGSFLNTELTARYFAYDFEEDFGKLQFYGIGMRHTLDNYIKGLPFSLNIGYMYQSLDAGDEISIQSHLPSLWLGKAGKNFSGQVMLGYQISNATINYTYKEGNTTENVLLNLKNKSPFMAEVSAGVKLGFLIIHAAVSYSGPLTGAGGITFKF
ncbi:MAG: DUF6588 family protein [Saprospiraceae bacterium]